MTIVDIQFSPANTDWPTLRAAAVEAEARGYGAVWVLDHLAGLPLGGTTMLEACTLLGAFAAVTDRIELGTMVANVWNRQVGTLVSAIASAAVIADRQIHFGLGAGAAPGSRWATEQHAVDADLEPSLAGRHQRVRDTLALADAQWRADRADRFSTFPLPRRRPTRIVGANSTELCRLAGELADGINLQWGHPRRDEFVAAVDAAVGDRPFLRTAYTTYEPELLDPAHPVRVSMSDAGYERVVLAVFDDLASWFADEAPVSV